MSINLPSIVCALGGVLLELASELRELNISKMDVNKREGDAADFMTMPYDDGTVLGAPSIVRLLVVGKLSWSPATEAFLPLLLSINISLSTSISLFRRLSFLSLIFRAEDLVNLAIEFAAAGPDAE